MDKPDALRQCIDFKLQHYFEHIDPDMPGNLYQMCIKQVEKPLFEAVMVYTKQNQSKAAKLLGINRSTLKKKLSLYQL